MATSPPVVFLDVNGVLQPFSKELCGGVVTEDHEFSATAMRQVRHMTRDVHNVKWAVDGKAWV